MSHPEERPVAMPVRLHLMASGDQPRHHPREGVRDPPLDEEGAANADIVEQLENPVGVAYHSLADRRVVVDRRLVPILDVNRECVGGCALGGGVSGTGNDRIVAGTATGRA